MVLLLSFPVRLLTGISSSFASVRNRLHNRSICSYVGLVIRYAELLTVSEQLRTYLTYFNPFSVSVPFRFLSAGVKRLLHENVPSLLCIVMDLPGMERIH